MDMDSTTNMDLEHMLLAPRSNAIMRSATRRTLLEERLTTLSIRHRGLPWFRAVRMVASGIVVVVGIALIAMDIASPMRVDVWRICTNAAFVLLGYTGVLAYYWKGPSERSEMLIIESLLSDRESTPNQPLQSDGGCAAAADRQQRWADRN